MILMVSSFKKCFWSCFSGAQCARLGVRSAVGLNEGTERWIIYDNWTYTADLSSLADEASIYDEVCLKTTDEVFGVANTHSGSRSPGPQTSSCSILRGLIR